MSPNSTGDGAHHVSVYDVSDPSQNQQFLAEFPTPGRATTVSLYNAIAYVADGASGLLAIRYLEPDRGTSAPSISVSTNFADGLAEEGQWMRFTSEVNDDVEVRNVQLFTDDNLVAAGSLIVVILTIIIYLALRRQFISGLSVGASKG